MVMQSEGHSVLDAELNTITVGAESGEHSHRECSEGESSWWVQSQGTYHRSCRVREGCHGEYRMGEHSQSGCRVGGYSPSGCSTGQGTVMVDAE